MKTLYISDKKRWYIGIPCILILLGAVLFSVFGGFAFAPEYAPGTHIKINMGGEFDAAKAEGIAERFAPGARVKTEGEGALVIESAPLTKDEREGLFSAIKEEYELDDSAIAQWQTVEKSAGRRAVSGAAIAALVGIALLMLYLFFRNEYSSGLAAAISQVIALLLAMALHVIFRLPVGESFAAAFFASVVMGGITAVIVFARVKDNTRGRSKRSFAQSVDLSIREVLQRALGFAAAAFILLAALGFALSGGLFLAAASVLIGALAGAYSGIFIAAPLWAVFRG